MLLLEYWCINNADLTPFDPVIQGNAFSAQVGFGAEAFYWAAESTIDLPWGDEALLFLALEATWANGEPADGDQIVFGRVQILLDVPADGTYTVVHPYGTEVFANVSAGVNAINMTRDIGAVAGEFNTVLTDDIGPFLIAVSPLPPTGFVGNPAVEQTVTGSPTGNNFFKITGPDGVNLDGSGGNVVQSNLFIVQGELAGPNLPAACTGDIVGDLNGDCKVDMEDLALLMANLFECNLDDMNGTCFGSDDPNIVVSPVTFNFGNVDVNTSSTPKTFTITNVGDANMAIGAITIIDSNADEFTFTDIDANGVTADINESVTFQVTFSPTQVGFKTAQVQIPFDTSSTATINLSGSSGEPNIASDLNSKDFGTVTAGDLDDANQVFTISNTGNDDLVIGTVSLTGDDASQFTIQIDNCSGLILPPLGTCTITAAFNPTTTGTKNAAVSIPSDDPDENPLQITLTGTATVSEVIIDNADSGASSTGTWEISGGSNPYDTNSLYSIDAGDTFTFSTDLFNIQHAVFMCWTALPSRFTNVPVQIYSGTTLLDTVTVNQQINGSEWVLLGIYTFEDMAKVKITAQANGSTNADAVKFTPVSRLTEIIIDNNLSGTSSTGTWMTSGGANPYGTNSVYSRNAGDTFSFTLATAGTFDIYACWTAWPSRSDSVTVEIYDGTTLKDTVSIDQTINAGWWNRLGTDAFTFYTMPKVKIITTGNDTSTNADAIKFVPSD